MPIPTLFSVKEMMKSSVSKILEVQIVKLHPQKPSGLVVFWRLSLVEPRQKVSAMICVTDVM